MKIFVGCSSAIDIPNKYVDDCKKLLIELFKDNDLVFGANDTGLMGLAYSEALAKTREIIGVCPKVYENTLKRLDCSKKMLVDNSIERTKNLIEESDIILILPGGFGTLHELFVAIDCKRSDEFNKPIFIYNSKCFFDELLLFLEKLYDEKFNDLKIKQVYQVFENVDELIEGVKSVRKSK